LVGEWDLALVMVLVQETVSSLVKKWDLVLVEKWDLVLVEKWDLVLVMTLVQETV